MTVCVEVVGRGPDLTLLHGWGLNGAVWNGLRDALVERFTLHIVDLPGHGYSADTAITTIGAMMNDVANAIPARSHLLGWSLGGQVALEMARCHRGRVEKLVLVATTPCFMQRENWSHGVSPDVLADFGSSLLNDTAATIRRFLALQVLSRPNMRDTMAVLQRVVTSRGDADTAALAAGLEILRTTDLRAQLAGIDHASLVLQGEYDELTPEPAGRWLATSLPNARYAMMAGAAHAPFLSHPDAFLHELESFLAA
jgi:pimeloyl-[acyl-carrier protein] methyl ester esterase